MGKLNESEPNLFQRRRYLQLLGAGAGIGFGTASTAFGSGVASAATTDHSSYQPSGAGAVVDSFEDEDLSEYDIGSSGEGDASFVSSPSFFGEHSLYLDGSIFLSSKSGLRTYPSSGDRFGFYFQPDKKTGFFDFHYGYLDANNSYKLTVGYGEDDLSLYRISTSDSSSPVPDVDRVLVANSSTSSPISTGEWYKIEINWGNDGTHSISLLDTADKIFCNMSGSDSTFSDGGIGLDNEDGRVYFDSIISGSFDDQFSDRLSSHEGVRNYTVNELSNDSLLGHYEVTCEFEDGTMYQFSQEVYEDLRVRFSDESGDYWGAVTDRGMQYVEDQLASDMGIGTTGGA